MVCEGGETRTLLASAALRWQEARRAHFVWLGSEVGCNQFGQGAPCSQYFRDRPGLCDTSAGSEGRVTIENFAERAQAVRVDLASQRFQKTGGGRAIPIHAQMRQNEWTEQPTPHGALMIGAVTLSNVAAIVSLVAGLALRETAKSVGSHEFARTNIHHRLFVALA